MSTKHIGPDGVQFLYPTVTNGTEFFLNMEDPYKGGAYTSRSTATFNISYGQANTFPFTTHKDPSGLVFFNTTGSPITYKSGGNGRSVRLDCFPDGGRNANKTSFSWQNNPGFLYTDKGIGSAEMTAFIRVHGDLGKHQSYAFKMSGRDEDAIRSLFEMVYPTATHADIQCNYNYAHFPYVNVKPNHTIPNPPPLADNGKWIGAKTVHKIASDRKSSDWEMWVDVDPFDATGAPSNNWVLAATYHDVGTSGYNNVPTTWKCHKDLVRIDGFASVDFTLISDREIDFSGAPIPIPNPTPTPNPTPSPTPTPVPTPIPTPTPTPIPVPTPVPVPTETLQAFDQTLTTNINSALTSIHPIVEGPDTSIHITIGIVDQPNNGTVSGAEDNITYTPNAEFVGTDSFTFSGIDSEGQQSNIATITINVMSTSTRKQIRHTSVAGEPVPDQFWTIDSDTGPLVGPSPVPGNLPIAAVTSIGAEAGNPATNAIDGDLKTRWSNNGGGSWIQLDLGQLCDLTEVAIAWYKGDQRTSNFAIDLSADSKTFQNAVTAVSTGKSLTLESNKLQGKAKLVKITVNGNSQNTWASITEITVKGAPSTPGPTPTGVQAIIAAPSQTVPPGAVVTLDGSQSKGDITAFMWSQTNGTAVNILNSTKSICSFAAHGITESLGFSLRVTDKSGQTSTANAIVQISSTPLPCPPGQHRDSTGNCVPDVVICPPGQHLDPTTNTCVPDVIPPGTNTDSFGVKKIYGDGPGSNYVMTADPSSDPRGNNPEASSSYKPRYIKNSDGSFKIKGQIEIRGAITQDNGFNQSKMCTDFTKCAQQGFMQDSMDWKDIEMTSYYRINQAGSSASNGESHIEHVMRGQRSTTSNSTFGGPCTCALGCSDNYHANIYCNKGKDGSARQKYEKDLFHTTGYSSDIAGVNNNSAYNFKLGAWFGIKTIVYNLPDGSVQLEHWTDENASNTWVKTHSFIDHDQWGPRGSIGNCNIPSSKSGSPPITFGGPLTVFRSDNITDYDVKWQSIRSIDSTKKLMGREHLARGPGVTDKTVFKEDEIYQAIGDEDKSTEKDDAQEAKEHADIISTEAKNPTVRKEATKISNKLDESL